MSHINGPQSAPSFSTFSSRFVATVWGRMLAPPTGAAAAATTSAPASATAATNAVAAEGAAASTTQPHGTGGREPSSAAAAASAAEREGGGTAAQGFKQGGGAAGWGGGHSHSIASLLPGAASLLRATHGGEVHQCALPPRQATKRASQLRCVTPHPSVCSFLFPYRQLGSLPVLSLPASP